MATVHDIRPQSAPLLSKRQLAAVLQRSPRWIEMRQRDGMPYIAASPRYPHNRYNLQVVEAWLLAGEARRPASLMMRVEALEAENVRILAELDELRAEIAS